MGGTLGWIINCKLLVCNALWFCGSDGSDFLLYPPNNIHKSLSLVVNYYG
jgi:hypothetical protein